MSGKKGHKSRRTRACLIRSARSGGSAPDLVPALSVLAQHGWEVEVREKRVKGDAAHIARKAAAQGYDPIVNCGGDGTLNEIVEALRGTDVAVGTIPGGTANVWSKEIGIAQPTCIAARQLIASLPARVDVGRVHANGQRIGHFLMMAGLGVDGAVMQHVSRWIKNRIGVLAVGAAAIEALPEVASRPIRVDMDGLHWEGEVAEVVAGNVRGYGGFTHITPGAIIDDGLLDVCLFTPDGVWAACTQLASLLLRRRPSGGSSELYRAKTIIVRSETALPLQLDGSAIKQGRKSGPLEYQFSALPDSLTVLVPATYDGELFQHGLGRRVAVNLRSC